MENKMSLQARRELIDQVKKRYQSAKHKEKGKILDGLVAATGYGRKYAIGLLKNERLENKDTKPLRQRKYGPDVYQALLTLWRAANHICSKRLVPFLPDLISHLEHHGHLLLPPDVRAKLLTISPAAVDRLLAPTRQADRRGISATKPGSLLKKQIQVRTFAEWDDVVPGFFEADLVAHCGDQVSGVYLNTLVLTDIASGWTECLPLLQRGEAQVIEALDILPDLLPFSVLGLDTDNGSEFINYELLAFCKKKQITFTRSRAYKKNDQAHVEEKNGSIVRRLIGYDRYEGQMAWKALSAVYAILRLYVNFFQPSMKLISKERQGSKVHKSYDIAKTPYQRLMDSPHISVEAKSKLKAQYESLDPIRLLDNLKDQQNQFWQFAWKGGLSVQKIYRKEGENNVAEPRAKREYRRTPKPREPRYWRTRKDPFESVWSELEIRLSLDPNCTAKQLLEQLIETNPQTFSLKHLRTLQRRILNWRKEHAKNESYFLSLAAEAASA